VTAGRNKAENASFGGQHAPNFWRRRHVKINIKAKNSFNFLKGGQYLPDCQMFFIKISTNMLKKLPNLRGQYTPYYPLLSAETDVGLEKDAGRS